MAIYSCKTKPVDACHVKFFTTLMVSMAVVLYLPTSNLNVFMVLPMTWAEDRIMSTQVELQQDEVAWFNMFKMKTKSYLKKLQNTNSFCWWSVSAGFYHSGLCLQLGETLVSIASCYVYRYCTLETL